MALATALVAKLNEESIPLTKRLCLAKNAFQNTNLRIQHKEEMIIKWFCDLNNKDSEEVWKTLEECLLNIGSLNILGSDIRTCVKSSLVQVVQAHTKKTHPHCIQLLALQCSLNILQTAVFQQHFSRNLEELFQFCASFFENLSELESTFLSQKTAIYLQCLSYIISFSKQSSVRGKLSHGFISHVSVPIVKTIVMLQHNSAGSVEKVTDVEKETIKFLQQVLLPKSSVKEIVSSICSVFEAKHSIHNRITETVLYTLLSAKEKFTADVVSKLYAVIFSTIITEMKNENNSVFQALVLFSFLIGFRPKVVIRADESKTQLLKHKHFKTLFDVFSIEKPKAPDEKSLKVLKSLLEIVFSKEPNLDAVIGEVTMLTWLQALLLSIVSDVPISDSTFEVLCCFVQFSPLVVEPKITDLLKDTMFSSKPVPSLVVEYTRFMCAVLEMFMKLHRLQKFISKLLTTLKEMFEGPITSGMLILEVSNVFPEKFCLEFSKDILLLQSSQIISMMRTFIYHLKEDCVSKLPNCRNEYSCESTEFHAALVSNLLCHFLNGIRLAEHTVPVSVHKRFREAMDDLADSLGKFGSALVQIQHRPLLVVSYLEACHSWGHLYILLLNYCESESQTFVPHFEDSSATNLTPLHHYLPPGIWALLTQRVINFGEKPCKDILRRLVMQKQHALLLRDLSVKGVEESIRNIQSYLLSSALERPDLLMESAFRELLLNCLEQERFLKVAENVVDLLNEDSSLTSKLFEPGINETRSFVIAVLWAVLIKTRKCFMKFKRKSEASSNSLLSPLQLARNVLSKIEPNVGYLEEQTDSLSVVVEKMATLINSYCETEQQNDVEFPNGFSFSAETCHQCLKVLQRLPLLHMSEEVQMIVFMSTLAVLLTTEKLCSSLAEESSDIKETCCEILIGLLETMKGLGSHLELGYVILHIHRLNMTPTADHLRQQLLSQFALQLLSPTIQEEQLTKNLDTLLEACECDSTWEIGKVVLQALSKEKRHLKPANRSICKLYQRKFSCCLITYLRTANVKKSPELMHSFMKSFSLTLSNCLLRKKEKQLNRCLKFLDVFVQLAFCSAKTSGSEAEDAITLLSTILRHRNRLGSFLPPDFVTTAWTKVTTDTVVSLKNTQILLEAASLEEFSHIIHSLSQQTRKAISNSTPDNVEKCLDLWKAAIKSSLGSAKESVRCSTLGDVIQMLFSFVSLRISDECRKEVLQFLHVAVNHIKEVQLVAVLTDLCFITILQADLCLIDNVTDMLAVSNLCMQLLAAMVVKWEVHVLDRIPLLLLCVRTLMFALAERADVTRTQKIPISELAILGTCCHELEKLVNIVIRHKKHFARVCPYIVADILNIFQKFTIHQTLKMHMTNCVYSFLALCDTHAIAFLMQILPPAPKEIFKTVLENFKRYYQYTGKV